MNKTKTIQKIKPSNHDISFQYICRNCGSSYWLFMREVCTKNFFVVCDCGDIIKPKRISKITVHYQEDTSKTHRRKKKKKSQHDEKVKKDEDNVDIKKTEIDPDILFSASKNLMSLGFTEKEAKDLIKKSYEVIGKNDCAELVKYSMNLVDKND